MYQLFIFKSSANNINGKIIKITRHIFKPSNFSIYFLYRCKHIGQIQKFLFAVVRPIPIRYLQALSQGLQIPVAVYKAGTNKNYFDCFSFIKPPLHKQETPCVCRFGVFCGNFGHIPLQCRGINSGTGFASRLSCQLSSATE